MEVHEAKLLYSIDDALSWRNYAEEGASGWNSGTYSTINMNSQSLTLDNPEFTFALGENILERSANTNDLASAIGRTFSVTLTGLQLISGVNSMAMYDLDSVYGDLSSYADRTTFILSEDDSELAAKNLTADISIESLKYEISGTDLYMTARLNVTLAAAPRRPRTRHGYALPAGPLRADGTPQEEVRPLPLSRTIQPCPGIPRAGLITGRQRGPAAWGRNRVQRRVR